LQCVAVCCSVLQCVAVCCSVLQRVAVCCSVLQFVVGLLVEEVLLGVYCAMRCRAARQRISFLTYNHSYALQHLWLYVAECCRV